MSEIRSTAHFFGLTGIQIGTTGSGNEANENIFYGCGTEKCVNWRVEFIPRGYGNVFDYCGVEDCGSGILHTNGWYDAGVRFGNELGATLNSGNSLIGCYFEACYAANQSYLIHLDTPGNSIMGCTLSLGGAPDQIATDFFYWTVNAYDCVILGNTYNGYTIPDVKNSIGGHTMIQTDLHAGWGTGADATLFLGDQYQGVSAVFANGLNFLTCNNPSNAFRWKNNAETEL